MSLAKPAGRIDVRQLAVSGVSDRTLTSWAATARRRLPAHAGALSISIVGPARSRQLNRTYRRKDKPTNVLSFHYPRLPIAEGSQALWGEIILCPAVIRSEARLHNRSYRQHLRFLLEHGLIHLLNLDHQTPAEQRRWQRYEHLLHP